MTCRAEEQLRIAAASKSCEKTHQPAPGIEWAALPIASMVAEAQVTWHHAVALLHRGVIISGATVFAMTVLTGGCFPHLGILRKTDFETVGLGLCPELERWHHSIRWSRTFMNLPTSGLGSHRGRVDCGGNAKPILPRGGPLRPVQCSGNTSDGG
jgi:hypothetical protein